MKALITNNEETMSHVQIAKLTGTRNDNVKRTMSTLAKKELITIISTVEPQLRGGKPTAYYTVSMEDAEIVIHGLKYKNLSTGARYHEAAALATIEQLLSITLKKEYSVLGYRIDGYCVETNTAYEIDEEQHFVNGKLRKECVVRQALIEKELGCTFVRIKV